MSNPWDWNDPDARAKTQEAVKSMKVQRPKRATGFHRDQINLNVPAHIVRSPAPKKGEKATGNAAKFHIEQK